jgi:signal transduction histidine kinase
MLGANGGSGVAAAGIASSAEAGARPAPSTRSLAGDPKPVGTIFQLFLIALSPLLALGTVFVVFFPGFYVAVIAPDLDAVINTATTIAAGGIAAFAWIRFRQTDQPDALYQAAAFMLLFIGGAFSLLLFITHADVALGFSSSAPGQAPLYLWTLQRLMAAALLVAGATAVLRRWSPPRPALAAAVVVGPIVGLFAVAVVVFAVPHLPALVPPSTLNLLIKPLDIVDLSRLSLPMIFLQLVVAGLFLVAAYNYARLHTVDRRPYSASLEIGLIIAAFSQVHSAIVPSPYNGLVASADVLRFAFYAVLLAGVANAARQDLIALRQANANLVRLQAAEGERAATQERSRLARDIHDGLLQELWLARLTHARLTQMRRMPREASNVISAVDGMLEDAIAEARHAVASLQPSEDTSLGAALQRMTDDYSDHSGLQIALTIDNDPGHLRGGIQGEVLRICREALNNVRKHADASVVRVRLRSDGGSLRLMISDNGRGFEVAKAQAGFGLLGMRQRAESIGGTLFIESQPLDGTQVILDVPVLAGEPE